MKMFPSQKGMTQGQEINFAGVCNYNQHIGVLVNNRQRGLDILEDIFKNVNHNNTTLRTAFGTLTIESSQSVIRPIYSRDMLTGRQFSVIFIDEQWVYDAVMLSDAMSRLR